MKGLLSKKSVRFNHEIMDSNNTAGGNDEAELIKLNVIDKTSDQLLKRYLIIPHA